MLSGHSTKCCCCLPSDYHHDQKAVCPKITWAESAVSAWKAELIWFHVVCLMKIKISKGVDQSQCVLVDLVAKWTRTCSLWLSQSCQKCSGGWWWGLAWKWTSVWGFYSWCQCLACLLCSLCPSSWWWRVCLRSFTPSVCTGTILITSEALSSMQTWKYSLFCFFRQGGVSE